MSNDVDKDWDFNEVMFPDDKEQTDAPAPPVSNAPLPWATNQGSQNATSDPIDIPGADAGQPPAPAIPPLPGPPPPAPPDNRP